MSRAYILNQQVGNSWEWEDWSWLDFYVHPSSILGRGTQGGWGPRMAQSDGCVSVDGSTCCCYFPVCFWILKCPVLFFEALVTRKSREGKRILPFLSDALTKGGDNEPPAWQGQLQVHKHCLRGQEMQYYKKMRYFLKDDKIMCLHSYDLLGILF